MYEKFSVKSYFFDKKIVDNESFRRISKIKV